ncbi:hypothetical protein AAE478_008325 [Parahypoxylon ruwenzoriense]
MSPAMIRSRVANACDACKKRKVKCDGNLPCSYCRSRRQNLTCHFSPGTRRRARRPYSPSPGSVPSSARPDQSPDTAAPDPQAGFSQAQDSLTIHSDTISREDETDVPREARLLCDPHGKLIFIGDCAPLSLFQTVRQIVTSRVDPNAFTSQTSRVSMLENSISNEFLSVGIERPHVDSASVERLTSIFITVTSGLVDLFDNVRVAGRISSRVANKEAPRDAASAVDYLVLAIGSQSVNEESAAQYFHYAKNLALCCLGGDLGTETVQAFALITLYMLRACQINGAFLFFGERHGIAARAAYSIGLHRTEVNSRFEAQMHTRRDRLWKSLRILDLFLSISMGRPPSMSDIDCTVPFRAVGSDGREKFDLLDASVQILSITEQIVLQVYSRRKISLQLTEGISRQLRDWSSRCLLHLKRIIAESPRENTAEIVGACQVMSSYYYAVMLVSRPFLMYELYKRLPERTGIVDLSSTSSSENSGRAMLANACIDAASLMAESVLDLVNQRLLDGRMPLIVSWLFASSLVLGVGLLGSFGRVLEKYAQMSITALEYFARNDTHAVQYSLIAKSLLSSALEYLRKRDTDERLQITESSSKLFGLIPKERATGGNATSSSMDEPRIPASSHHKGNIHQGSLNNELPTSPFHDIDPALLSLGCPLDPASGSSFSGGDRQGQTEHVFGALNLFPLLDGNGHIDLAHYL